MGGAHIDDEGEREGRVVGESVAVQKQRCVDRVGVAAEPPFERRCIGAAEAPDIEAAVGGRERLAGRRAGLDNAARRRPEVQRVAALGGLTLRFALIQRQRRVVAGLAALGRGAH